MEVLGNRVLCHVFKIPTTIFRFFTVYGPWGRPDMALFKFTKKILNNQKIDIFNYGQLERDFTYIDDLVDGVYKLVSVIPTENSKYHRVNDSLSSLAPYRIVNIGNSKPINFLDLVYRDARKISKIKPFGPIGTYNGFNSNHPLDRRIDYIFVDVKRFFCCHNLF